MRIIYHNAPYFSSCFFMNWSRKPLCAALSIKGDLFRLYAEIEAQARARLAEIITSQINAAVVTEVLKSEEPMEWVQRMNRIRARASAVIHSQMIDI